MQSSFKTSVKAILSVFNYRLLIILTETILIFFLYEKYKINIDIDYTIMSIAIVFPLVFSITSAYQRRQDSITLYLEFRNKIIDLTNIFFAVEGVEEKDYTKLFDILQNIQLLLIKYLIQKDSEELFNQLREKRKEVLLMLDSHKKLYNVREKDSLIRIKNELFLSAEKVRGIKIHGTPISLKKYCLLFIYFSPFLYNSQLIFNSHDISLLSTVPLLYSLVVSFVLMTLYNVQDYIENPFDQKGLDDLKINSMKVNQWESIYSKENQ